MASTVDAITILQNLSDTMSRLAKGKNKRERASRERALDACRLGVPPPWCSLRAKNPVAAAGNLSRR